MPEFERDYRMAIYGGGHGPRIFTDPVLNITPNVFSIVGVHDDGGQSGEWKKKGKRPGGDTISRAEMHVRNLRTRQLFWRGGEGSHFEGRRIITDLLAFAEEQTNGSFIEAVKLLEQSLANYVGRVLPISEDHVDLKIDYQDGTSEIGEHHIDLLKPQHSPIKQISYYPQTPTLNPEAIEYIQTAQAHVIAPGTFHGSILPLLMIDEVQQAIKDSKAPVFWFCNAINLPETYQWQPSDYARRITELGIPIDYAFLTKIKGKLPPAYAKSGSYKVRPDKLETQKYAKNVEVLEELTYLEDYTDELGSRLIVRHNGDLGVARVINILDEIRIAQKLQLVG